MKDLISRVAFCEECKKHDRPNKGELAAVVGGSSETFKLIEGKRSSQPGMTPHFFLIQHLENNQIKGLMCCGMLGCGTEVHSKRFDPEEGDKYDISLSGTREFTMNVKDWEALQNFTDTGYKI